MEIYEKRLLDDTVDQKSTQINKCIKALIVPVAGAADRRHSHMAHPILHWFSLRPVPDSSGGWPEPGKEMQSGGAGHGPLASVARPIRGHGAGTRARHQ